MWLTDPQPLSLFFHGYLAEHPWKNKDNDNIVRMNRRFKSLSCYFIVLYDTIVTNRRHLFSNNIGIKWQATMSYLLEIHTLSTRYTKEHSIKVRKYLFMFTISCCMSTEYTVQYYTQYTAKDQHQIPYRQQRESESEQVYRIRDGGLGVKQIRAKLSHLIILLSPDGNWPEKKETII